MVSEETKRRVKRLATHYFFSQVVDNSLLYRFKLIPHRNPALSKLSELSLLSKRRVVTLKSTKGRLLTTLQSFLESVLNGVEFLLFNTGLCEALGRRTTALNDFLGEPFQIKKKRNNELNGRVNMTVFHIYIYISV